MKRLLILILMLSLIISCAHEETEEEDQTPPEKTYRSWTEFCREKHPGCELVELNFHASSGEEICKCKKPKKPVKSPNGEPAGDFHP